MQTSTLVYTFYIFLCYNFRCRNTEKWIYTALNYVVIMTVVHCSAALTPLCKFDWTFYISLSSADEQGAAYEEM